MAERADELIAGRYRPLKIIGRGAVADVWEAADQHSGTAVALKLVHTRLATDDDTRLRFEREVETLRRLHHGNVVELYDAGIRRGGMPFLALELLRGRSLLHELVREKRFATARMSSVTQQVLSGLDAAHQQGIIHRDLKPANVVLVPIDGGGDRAVLVDFGLVSVAGAPGITQQGSVVGSPSYIAPERLRGERFDERSDLYSVGVMMFEMLTGQRPFAGKNTEDTIIMSLTNQPSSPREVAPDLVISDALEDLVMRTLGKYPDERPSSAAEMAGELAAAR